MKNELHIHIEVAIKFDLQFYLSKTTTPACKYIFDSTTVWVA